MTDQLKDLAEQLSKARDDAQKAVEDVKGLGAELKGRMEKEDKVTTEMKGDVDQLLTKMNTVQAQLGDLEQKAARSTQATTQERKSIGDLLVESEQFKSYAANPGSGTSARIHQKAVIDSTVGDAAGNAGALVQPQLLPGILTPPQQRLTIRDLLSPGRTDSNAITYIKETGFTNSAAMVKEGALKPQSDLKYGSVTETVKTIAHTMKASRQILSDAPMLSATINERLMYGLKLVEERQLLNGDGADENLHGIITQATAFADPATLAQYSIIDQLRLAMLQAVLAEYPATGHVLNPIEWAKIETLKDENGRYIIGNPQGSINPTLWALPVVQTQAIQQGQFLTGAFKLGAQIFDRWDMSVAVATQNEDDFMKNRITVLCEERLALAVYRPEAFIYGKLAEKTA